MCFIASVFGLNLTKMGYKHNDLPFLPQSLHAEYAVFLKTVSGPSPQQAAGYSLKIK